MIQKMCDKELCGHIISLVEFDICSLELEYVVDKIICVIYNSNIREVILKGNNTILLCYGHSSR